MSRTLAEFERWLQREIANPTAARGARLRRVEREIEPSRALSSHARLELYRDLVRTRLVECLRGEFQGVARALGARRFERIAQRYVSRHPSRHFSLNQLGARFAGFLARQRAPHHVVELARLERAIEDVFDAPREQVLQLAELNRDAPSFTGALCIQPIRALRVVASTHDVAAYLDAARKGRRPSVVRHATLTLVWRRGAEVRRRELEPLEARLLRRLARSTSLAAALRGLPSAQATQVEAFFARAVRDGLFRSADARPETNAGRRAARRAPRGARAR